MIQLEQLGLQLGAFALDAIDLRVEQGQYCTLLGPSGAGKSLLLALIAGLQRPSSGRIIIDGNDVGHLPPERRGIGLVFQQPALFEHLSVTANLSYGLRLRGLNRSEQRRQVDDMVQVVGLQALIDRRVAVLSGGEARRVALARALLTRPRVLLLDEPLAPLDHNARAELQAELGRLHRELGLTTLHVTHSRDEARALATQAAVLAQGRLIQHDRVDVVFEHPRCAEVARFLGVEANQAADCQEAGHDCFAAGGRCIKPARYPKVSPS